MKKIREDFMNINTLKASGLLLGLPIVGSFLFSACGGEGGGNGIINPNQTPPTNYTLAYPANNDSNVCTFPEFRVHFPEEKDCGIQDLNKVIGIFPTGATQSIGVSQAFKVPSTSGNSGCDYVFNPAQSLPGLTQVRWGVMNSSVGSNLESNSQSFTTANANLVSCGNNNSRFVLSQSIPGQIMKGSTDIGSTGIFDASTNKFDFDFSSFANLLIGQIVSFQTIFGFGDVGTRDPILLTFNHAANEMLLKASIKVYELNMDPTGLIPTGVGNSIGGISIAVVSGGPTAYVYAINPPTAGWAPSSNLMVYINKTVVSTTGQVLTDEKSSTARSFVGRVKVSS